MLCFSITLHYFLAIKLFNRDESWSWFDVSNEWKTSGNTVIVATKCTETTECFTCIIIVQLLNDFEIYFWFVLFVNTCVSLGQLIRLHLLLILVGVFNYCQQFGLSVTSLPKWNVIWVLKNFIEYFNFCWQNIILASQNNSFLKLQLQLASKSFDEIISALKASNGPNKEMWKSHKTDIVKAMRL